MRGAVALLGGLWGWCQARANPIVTKELRATVRQRRFLIIHFVAVTVVAVLVSVVVVTSAAQELASYQASSVGQALFYTCAVAQGILITMLVPGMTAPALVEERANRSLELLITTRLSPRQIVVGKLISSLVTVLLLLVSWMPLVAVTFLFGGVGMLEVGILYLQLCALALLLAVVSLHCSAVEKSPRRAVIYAYFLSALVGGVFWLGAGTFWAAVMSGALQFRVVFRNTNWLLAVVGAPVLLFVFLIGSFILSAINRMKPASANRSTNMRVFFVVMAGLCYAICLTAFLVNVGTFSPREQQAVLSFYLLPAALTCLLAALVFATEEPLRFERLRRQRARLRGLLAPLRLFCPGPGSGAVLALLLAVGLLVAGLAVVFWSPAIQVRKDDVVRLARLSGLALSTVLMTAGLAYAVAARLRRTTLCRFVVLLVVNGLLFVPLLSLLIRSGDLRWNDEMRSALWHGDYLSSVVATCGVMSEPQWRMRGRRMPEEVEVFGRKAPLEALTHVAYVLLGVVGLAFGCWSARRFETSLAPLDGPGPQTRAGGMPPPSPPSPLPGGEG